MKKATALLLSCLFVFVLTACGGASGGGDAGTSAGGSSGALDHSSNQSASAAMPQTESLNMGFMGYSDALSEDAADSIVLPDSAIYTDPNAKVIRTAELIIQTLEFEQSVAALAQLTEEQGGYYETAQVDGGGYYDQQGRRSAYYVVRVPKGNFVAFRDAVGQVGHLYSINENARNVGEDYYDTETRLETLITKQERLLALLDKAELMEDIISLETALADVQYEIDMHTSTLRKYDSLIDYSTFTIHLEEVIEIVQEPGPQDSFGTRLLASLKDGASDFGRGIQAFSLWVARNIIGIVIWIVIIVAAVKIALWQYRKRRSKRSEDK